MDGSVSFEGLLKGSIADGGSTVVITPVVTSGTKIADVSVGGVEKNLYTPDYGADITALDGRLDIAEDNITSLTGRVGTAEGNITNLAGHMTEAETDITEIKQSLSNLIKSRVISGTTTATGALILPNDISPDKIISCKYTIASGALGLVYPRGDGCVTCLASSLQPFSKTSVEVIIWYTS